MKTKRLMRATGTGAGPLLICAALAGFPQLGVTGKVWAQVPDNRGVKFNPEDSAPPAYRDTVDERDRRRLGEARRQGESFMPTVQGRGRNRSPGHARPDDAGVAERAGAGTAAPPLLERPERRRPAPRPAYEAYRPQEGGRSEGSNGPEDGISDLIDVLLRSWSKPPEIVRIRYPSAVTRKTAAAAAPATRPRQPSFPLPAAGSGIYARTLYAVNSDYPGPVLLELLEPPLSGAVAAGAFTLVDERMVLRLTSLEYRGRRVAADGWAVGLDCACYGIAGEVDSHFFRRVLLPAAVSFAEGFLTAMGRPAESISVGSGDVRYERRESSIRDAAHTGLGTAARSAGNILLETVPRRPTIRIPRDTELIVLFARSPGSTPESGPQPSGAVPDVNPWNGRTGGG